jgi:hypothetical protein
MYVILMASAMPIKEIDCTVQWSSRKSEAQTQSKKQSFIILY